MAAYHAAMKDRAPTPGGSTVADLITRFQTSPEFTRKAEATRREYARYLVLIDSAFGALTLKSLATPQTRGRFKDWRNGMSSKLRTADYAWSVLARLMSFGVDRGKLTRNPCQKGGRLYVADRAEKIWTDATLAAPVRRSLDATAQTAPSPVTKRRMSMQPSRAAIVVVAARSRPLTKIPRGR